MEAWPDVIKIDGTFSKAGDGKQARLAGFDPSWSSEDGTVLELITANALEGFSADVDADEYFSAKNLAKRLCGFRMGRQHAYRIIFRRSRARRDSRCFRRGGPCNRRYSAGKNRG